MSLSIYSGISSLGYLLVFFLSKYNYTFQKWICPTNYIKGYTNIHEGATPLTLKPIRAYELVSYGISTIHASIVSIGVIVYLSYKQTNIILADAILDIVIKISLGYFSADIIYVLSTIQKKTYIQNLLIIIHHLLMIYYEQFALNINNPLYSPARYYLSRAMCAELAIIPLNYGWYLINTRQTHTQKFLITGIITIGTYFVSRICNITLIYWDLLHDGYIKYSILGLPLVIMNFYWFNKLITKAITKKN